MLAEIGTFVVGVALTTAIYAAFAAFWAIRRNDSRWSLSARNAVYSVTGLLGGAIILLLAAFLTNQFQIRYVADHSSRVLPFYLKVSAVWAGQEGSLLLWAFLQALFATLVMRKSSLETYPFVPWAMVFLNLITAFFIAVTLFLSNPFVQTATLPPDGRGLNPLLRHPGMIFHPPAMYLGYVGAAAPFAFALAALITRRVDDWPVVAHHWTLLAWFFLGVGLLLGMRWAYDVLGWGGYWGWDPVENAGLMPWLTITAFLHGAVMQQERGGFRWWNLSLIVLSFVLVLFGTFTTRSGLIQSVHAFARSNLGPYFLAAIALTLIGAFALIFSRRSVLVDSQPLERLLSRGGMFLLTLIVLLTITGSVFIGSVLPTLTEALLNQRFEASPAWFDRVTGPQFALLVLLVGVCPLLGRAANALRRLRVRAFPAAVGGILAVTGAVLAGFTQPLSLVGFITVGLAGATTAMEYVRDALDRSRRLNEGPLLALWRLFGRNRRKYGGYLVHAGVVLMALGVIGTRLYSFETEVVFSPGESVEVEGYTLTYEDFERKSIGDHLSTWASFSVYRGGNFLTTLQPRLDQYPDFVDQTISVPALRVGLREDLYLVLAGWGDQGATAMLKVFINPLAVFLWLGGLVFLGGGLVALWPTARPAPRARRWTAWATVWVIGGVLMVIVAALTMWWGPGARSGATGRPASAGLPSSSPQTIGRPRPGQMAPDFTLTLLDGSAIQLAELQDQVAVINFWATWCPPCEDELPDFQVVWDEYRDHGAIFVGVAAQEDEDEVRAMLDRFGVTYPVGLDLQGKISAAYGITGVPETFVVDATGRVADVYIGPASADELRRVLDRLIDR